jgi:putative ABC transport system substrate-binding protein
LNVVPKRLELLHELLTTAKIMALLVNPTSPAAEIQSTQMQTAAAALALQFHIPHARTELDFDTVLRAWVSLALAGLLSPAPIQSSLAELISSPH